MHFVIQSILLFFKKICSNIGLGPAHFFYKKGKVPMVTIIECRDIENDITVVSFCVKRVLTEETILKMRDELFALVKKDEKKKILLNWSNVEYFHSSGLGPLITLKKMVDAAGGQLVLCSINPDIWEVFEITKLNKLFNAQEDIPRGIAIFN